MGKSWTNLPSRNGIRPTPCFGRVTGAKQPHTFRSPATWPRSHCGQRDRYLVTAIRSEQFDRFIITCVVIAVSTYAPRSNLRRLSSTAQLGRNGRTPVQVAQQVRPQNEGQQVPRPVAAQQEAPPQGHRFEDVRRMIEDSLAQRCPEAPRYAKPYLPEIDRIHLPRNYRLPEFILFSGDGQTSFTAQCREADSDAQRLRLFVHSLTGAVFSWFINLPPNSVRDWSDMERIFHEHFYQTNREITVTELARMRQASDESPRDYLQ
ncbi:unnamed protein product [Prunus armeniaca]